MWTSHRNTAHLTFFQFLFHTTLYCINKWMWTCWVQSCCTIGKLFHLIFITALKGPSSAASNKFLHKYTVLTINIKVAWKSDMKRERETSNQITLVEKKSWILCLFETWENIWDRISEKKTVEDGRKAKISVQRWRRSSHFHIRKIYYEKIQQMRAKQSWSSGPGKNRVRKLNKMTTGAEHIHTHT